MGKNLKGKELGKGLSQRKNGKYDARFVTSSGKRITKYFDKLQDAKLWLSDARYDDRHGNIVASSNMTVNAWYNFWIENIKAPNVRPNTTRNYSERYKANIQPILGHMIISDVKPMHCSHVLNSMAENYKGSTIQQVLITMYNMFDSAEENGIISKNPVTRAVKNPNPIVSNPRCLTKDEQRRFLAVAKGTSNYPQYQLLLETGLRTSEMIGLKWEDIDFKHRTIQIKRNLGFRYGTQKWIESPPKTTSSYRTIPMTDTCYKLLRNLQQTRKQSGIIVADERFKDIVFINRKGMPTKNSTYDSHLYKLADKAGIKRFSMHTLRHTFATRCIEANITMKTLSVILGHSNIGITMNTYVHVMEEQKHSEMQKLTDYKLLEHLI